MLAKDQKVWTDRHKPKGCIFPQAVFEVGINAANRCAVEESTDERWDRSRTE